MAAWRWRWAAQVSAAAKAHRKRVSVEKKNNQWRGGTTAGHGDIEIMAA